MKYKYSKLQIRRGSREYWESKNPILLQGEPGYDTSNKVLKIGDGNNKWNDLEGINVQNINVDDIKEDILS